MGCQSFYARWSPVWSAIFNSSHAKIVLIEAGFARLPPLMWRLDQSYNCSRGSDRSTSPALEYIRQHFWLTQRGEFSPQRHYFLNCLNRWQ